MRARAPGKLVLSGAYAVLEGAPALVAAVNRYALADTARPPSFLAEEVRVALDELGPWPPGSVARPAPWFDASSLREGGQKLGLGSSAAILVASLGALALEVEPGLSPSELAERVFEHALRAHAKAQGGGSGIDVAASTYGGVLAASRASGLLSVRPVVLPEGVTFTVLSLGRAASTAELIGRVREFARRDPRDHARCLGAQALASERALASVTAGDARGFVRALAEQARALGELGERALAPIVPPELAQHQKLAETLGAALLPAGAGGGDVALWVNPEEGRDLPPELGAIPRVSLTLGATGLTHVET